MNNINLFMLTFPVHGRKLIFRSQAFKRQRSKTFFFFFKIIY